MMTSNNIFFDLNKLKYLGKNTIIGKSVRIRNPEKVSIGDNVIIDDFSYLSGKVEIHNYCHIGASCTIQAGEAGVIIGELGGISSGVRVFAVSSNYIEPSFDLPTISSEYRSGSIIEKVLLDKYVIVGANSVVLPGCILPEGAAFAANSTISKRKYLPWYLYSDLCRKPLILRKKEDYLLKVREFLNKQK